MGFVNLIYRFLNYFLMTTKRNFMKKTISLAGPANIQSTERLTSVLAGSLLLINAFERKSFSFSKALAGGFFLYRGITGYCPAKRFITDSNSSILPEKANIDSVLSD